MRPRAGEGGCSSTEDGINTAFRVLWLGQETGLPWRASAQGSGLACACLSLPFGPSASGVLKAWRGGLGGSGKNAQPGTGPRGCTSLCSVAPDVPGGPPHHMLRSWPGCCCPRASPRNCLLGCLCLACWVALGQRFASEAHVLRLPPSSPASAVAMGGAAGKGTGPSGWPEPLPGCHPVTPAGLHLARWLQCVQSQYVSP